METHRDFSSEQNISFPLISDTDNTIRNLYERGRITFLIDKTGRVRYIQKGVPDNKRFFKEIERLAQ